MRWFWRIRHRRDWLVLRRRLAEVRRWPDWTNPSVTLAGRSWSVTVYAAGALLVLALAVIGWLGGFDDGVRYIVELGF